MLRAGQIIRYDQGLWKVAYVNPSRARIVPLGKRVMDTETDRSGGTSIAANSFVEVITDLEHARLEIELAEAEAELAAAKQELALSETPSRKRLKT